jgi:putative MATE family efflux protein
MSVCGLIGTGGAPLFSMARGRGNDAEAERIMGNSFTLLIIFGIVLMAGVMIFKRQILYAFGASDDTYIYASQYLTIYTMGTLFVMIGLGMNPFINAQGAANRGMMTVALGAAVNIVLDPIFIFALDMGVAGAALATVIAQLCSAIWVLGFLTGKRAILRLKLSCLRLEAIRVRKIITLGLSGFVMNLTNSLIQIVCNKTLLAYGGDLLVGVMTIINAVREIVFMPVSGIGSGVAPVLSFNYGASKLKRVKSAIQFSMLITFAYTAVICAVIMLAPQAFMRLFTGEEALIAAGMRPMRLYYMLSVFMCLQMTSQQVFVALGKSKQAIFFSLLRKAFIAAPLTLLLPVLGLGTDGVFIADTISQLVGGLACGVTMYFTVYRELAKNA